MTFDTQKLRIKTVSSRERVLRINLMGCIIGKLWQAWVLSQFGHSDFGHPKTDDKSTFCQRFPKKRPKRETSSGWNLLHSISPKLAGPIVEHSKCSSGELLHKHRLQIRLESIGICIIKLQKAKMTTNLQRKFEETTIIKTIRPTHSLRKWPAKLEIDSGRSGWQSKNFLLSSNRKSSWKSFTVITRCFVYF